jgi:hypothetical protein
VGDRRRAPIFEHRADAGNRWNKWRTSRSCVLQRHGDPAAVPGGQARGLRAHDAPELVGSYERGGFCFVVTGSTQYGRAYADPQDVPYALRYYDELRRRGDVVFRTSPYGASACRSRSTTRSTTTR